MKNSITDLSSRYAFVLLLFILQFGCISKLLMITKISADFSHLELFICHIFLSVCRLTYRNIININLTAYAFLFETDFTLNLAKKSLFV